MDIKKIKKTLFLGALSMTLTSCGTSVNPNPGNDNDKELPIDNRELSAFDYARYNLCGEDALGRTIERVNNLKTDKTRYVGLFYSIWIGQHQHQQSAIYDITELEKTPEGKEALASTTNNELSRVGEFHFWGEPLYGYYNSKDPFVLTRHIELLTNAGIDYLCIDATNNVVYYDATYQLFDLLLEFHKQGIKVPKVMFYTNSFSGQTVDKIYDRYYQTEKYRDIWFAPNGKPMIIGITRNNNNASDQTKYNPQFNSYISDEMMEFFDVKESEWPNGDHNDNSIPWMSWDYPQRIHDGSIAVPVAQHSHSKIYVSSKDPECSRGYDNVTKEVKSDFDSGHSFQQMWDRAHNSSEVDNVLVTSFNEWMAIKQPDATFVDVYNHEYSRDIEMMKGGYNDNFYLQLVRNVRKFKFDSYVEYKKDKYTIDITNGVSPIWDVVTTHYQDFEGDALNRNFEGAVKGLTYKQDSARNDIKLIKVAHDDENIYFYIECKEDITQYNGTDENYMNIFLKTNDTDPTFNGSNIIVNRKIVDGKGSIEKCLGDYSFEKVGEADIAINGNIMQVKIPNKELNMTSTNKFEFKVADNVTDYKDVMDYYVTGDVVPLGRMRYGY